MVPLLVEEVTTKRITAILDADPVMLVWWATETECASAICRLERDKALSGRQATAALSQLLALKAGWHEVQAVEPVRRTGQRLLRTHPLRAAEALQLGAALVAAEGDPGSMEMVTLDDRLAEAAEREGLILADTGGVLR